jgi:hypothetical protein
MHDDVRLLDAFNNQPKCLRALDGPVDDRREGRLGPDSLQALRLPAIREDRHEQKCNRRASTLSL